MSELFGASLLVACNDASHILYYYTVYEVVITVTTIYPNPLLLDAAATSISRFIRSDSNNLKYIGIKGLAQIVRDHPKSVSLSFPPDI